MNQLPDFWREEVWHPLAVHLPLSSLVLSALFFLISLFVNKSKDFWFGMAAVLLIIGTAGSWVAVYTGDIADSVVSRKLCDPTVLESHENLAYVSSWIFSGATVSYGLYYFLHSKRIRKLMKTLIVILTLTGSGFLIYVGHQGATLVYQQAAGVYVPSEDCDEFVD